MNVLAMVWIAAVAGSGVHASNVRWLPPGLEHLEAPLRDARVGDWVSYRIEGGAGREGHWRMAVVGQELDALGRSAVWLEIEFGADAKLTAPLLRFRMLVAKGAGIAPGGVTRLIVAFGFDRPQELEPLAIERVLSRQNDHSAPRPLSWSGVDDALSGDLVVHRGAQLRLLTAAGTVSATPVELFYRRTVVQRFWISPDVPVLHVARIELPVTSHTLEATGFGHQATARIPEPTASTPKIQLEPHVHEPGGR